MEKARNVSAAFRTTLKRELEKWLADGIISHEQAEAISQTYEPVRPPKEPRNLFILAIYMVGSLLVGGGVVSFVAAHWNAIPAAVKLFIIVAVMLAAHGGGFYLWKVTGKRERLGHALVTLGTLIFGANIGLVAQIFHIRAGFYNGFGAWAIGALAMAWAAGSVPNALIAVAMSFIWFCGWTVDHPHSFCYYPFLAAAALIPFAYLRRSVLVFATTLLAVGVSVMVCAGADGDDPWPVAVAGVGVASLCFSWGIFTGRSERSARFALPGIIPGALLAAGLAYLLSFREVAEEFVALRYWRGGLEGWSWVAPAAAAYAGSVVMWTLSFRSMLSDAKTRPAAIGALAALVMLFVGLVSMNSAALAVMAKTAYLAAAGGLLWSGAHLTARRGIRATVLFPFLAVASIVAGILLVVCVGVDTGEVWPAAVAAAGLASLWFSCGIFIRRSEGFAGFGLFGMVIGTVLAAVLAYLFSFHEVAEEVVEHFYRAVGKEWYRGGWLWVIPVAALFVISTAMWARSFRPTISDKAIRPLAVGTLAALVMFLVGLVAMNYVVLTVVTVAACLALTGGLVWGGLHLQDRRVIWAGVLFALLTFATRFFEYETSLLLKSVAFLASGGGLIYVGVKIESYLKKSKGT